MYLVEPHIYHSDKRVEADWRDILSTDSLTTLASQTQCKVINTHTGKGKGLRQGPKVDVASNKPVLILE